MLRLHHMSESTCSQRVRLVLAEKRLDWESVLLPPGGLRDEAYLALNPAGVVPTLIHQDHVLVESRIICEYLEEAFPGEPLMPLRAVERYRVRRWTKLFDDRLHLAIFVLSFVCWMRAHYLALPDAVRTSALPGMTDPVKRRIAENLLERGWDAEILRVALRQLVSTADALETALGASRWLGGDHFSLADVDLLTVIQRLDELGAGSLLDERAAIAGWLDRSRNRLSFALAFDTWRNEETARRHSLLANEAAERFAGLIASL
jgi:glutathione S-transferase